MIYLSKEPNLHDLPSRIEQGISIDCIHCTMIYPDVNRPDCPECHGKKRYFLPAQMMDKSSSQRTIINEIFNNKELLTFFLLEGQNLTGEKKEVIKSKCFALLRKTVIYNFDLKDLLVEIVRELDKT